MTNATPTAAPLLELDQVHRRRGGRPAVAGLSLRIERGDILGLLGVNGAGKSTTLALMTGALAPDRGRVLLAGRDLAHHPRAARAGIGWLPEHAPLYGELTVGEHLRAMARLHGAAHTELPGRCREVLAALGLEALERRLVRQLSQGQRQRVGIACAMVHAPPLLVLDEPSSGLDPVQLEQWRKTLRALPPTHAAVISTHVLEEVTQSCNRIAILHAGRLQHVGPVAGNAAALRERFLAVATGHAEAAP